jgi:hypothetical protein
MNKKPTPRKSTSPRLSKSKAAKRLLAILIRRGDAVRRRLEAGCGPAFTLSETAALLKVGTSRVMTMDRRGLLLGISHSRNRRFPAWQFDRGDVCAWVAPLIAKLGSSRATLHFLAVPRASLRTRGTYQSILAYLLARDEAGMANIQDYLRKPSAE